MEVFLIRFLSLFFNSTAEIYTGLSNEFLDLSHLNVADDVMFFHPQGLSCSPKFASTFVANTRIVGMSIGRAGLPEIRFWRV